MSEENKKRLSFLSDKNVLSSDEFEELNRLEEEYQNDIGNESHLCSALRRRAPVEEPPISYGW